MKIESGQSISRSRQLRNPPDRGGSPRHLGLSRREGFRSPVVDHLGQLAGGGDGAGDQGGTLIGIGGVGEIPIKRRFKKYLVAKAVHEDFLIVFAEGVPARISGRAKMCSMLRPAAAGSRSAPPASFSSAERR